MDLLKLKRAYVAFFALLVAIVVCAGACGFDPQIGEGAFACAADRSCPNGFVCAGDNKCYRPGNGPPVPTGDGGNNQPDSGPVVISKLQADPISLAEGNASVPTDFVFTVRLDPPSSKEVTVDYATNDGTAKVNEDFAGAAGKLIFPPGSTSQTVTVKVTADRFEEPDETFKLTLSNPVNAEFLTGAGPDVVATIKNDDSPGLAIDDITVTEGDQDTTATLTVSLSGTYATDVTVSFETLEIPAGTMTSLLPAAEGADFIATSDVLTFAPGDKTKSVVIPIKGDLAHEKNEGFTVKLSNAQGAPLVDEEATVTITDNDPIPTISIANVSTGEGDTGTSTMAFSVTLSAPSGEEVKVGYATGGGTAGTSDYGATTGTLTFPAGSTTQYVNVQINGDVTDEPDETLDVTLSLPVNATIAKATATGTITDDDEAPILTVEDIALAEGGVGTTTPFPFVLTLSAPSAKTITLTYATADVTAQAGSDYVTASQAVTFLPGETSKPAMVTVNGDGTGEGTETFKLNLTNPVNVTFAAAFATGTIINDDGAAATFAIADATPANEGNAGTQTYTFTVTCTGAITGTATVDYATANVTATSGSDYVAKNGTLSFATCPSTQNVTVTVNGDTVLEPNETFAVNLSNPSANTAITDSQGVGTINNDDTPPIISISSVTTSEGNVGPKNFVFDVTLSNAASTQITVNYATGNGATNSATAGTDYVQQTGTLTFAAGETSKQVTVTVNGDVTYEQTETFNVTLSMPSANATLAGGTSVGVGTITNDDTKPTISINDVTLNEGNSGTTNFVFTVSLSGPTDVAVSVNYATSDGTATTAGGDYTSKTGTVSIPAGSLSTTLTIAVQGNSISEPTETFNVTLSTPTPVDYVISDATGVGTITNDDAVRLITINDPSATEGNSITFTVSINPGSNGTTTVQWTLTDITTSASDRGATTSGTVSFSNGQTSKTITVTTQDDNRDEADETLQIKLSNVVGDATLGDDTGIGTIIDNDPTPTITISNASVTEGDAGTVNMTFNVALSAISNQQVTVNWTTRDNNSAVSGGNPGNRDYEAASGTLTWNPGDAVGKTITVVVKGDTTDEGNETFLVELSNPVNANLNGTGIATGTITDDDP